MLYNPPTGSTDPNAPYLGKVTAAGQQGSKVPKMAVEGPQREIVAVITEAGLAPTNLDLSQLLRSIRSGQLTTFTDTSPAPAPNTIVITPTTAHASLIKGLPFRIFPAMTNTATSVTLTVGTVLQARLKLRGGLDPAIGDIIAGVPIDVVFDGAAFRVISWVTSEILTLVSNGASVSTVVQNFVNISTPRGSTKLGAFTGGKILDDIATGGYSITQTTGSFKNASYVDVSATCAIRDLAGTGSEGSGTARVVLNNLTDGTVSYSNYVGGGAYYQNTQIPLVIPRVILSLDGTKVYSLGLALQKGSTVGQTQSYDAYIFAQHDGSNN